MSGILSDIRTPTGKRMTRWTLAPGQESADPEKLIDRLISQIERAEQVGWIRDTSLTEGIYSALRGVLDARDEGDHSYARFLLRYVLMTVDASTPAQLSSDARTLITLNVEAALAAD